MTPVKQNLEAVNTEVAQTDEDQRSDVNQIVRFWNKENWYYSLHSKRLALRKLLAEVEVAIKGKQ